MTARAKGRVERCFGTLQDRLVKALRRAGVGSLEAANAYLEQVFLPMWNQRFVCAPANAVNGHRSLEKLELSSILSVVEQRRVDNDHTVPWRGVKWQIPREAIRRGMRGSTLRVEQRLDGSMVARDQAKFIPLVRCLDEPKAKATQQPPHRSSQRFKPAPGQSRWMDQFRVKGNAAWQARRTIQNANSAWHQQLTFSSNKLACGSKEFDPPFPFPPQGQAGAGGFPPRRKHAARQQKALARIDAAGSPHKRAAAPLCIPRERRRGSGSSVEKTGTFYLAKNRNFLLGLDTGLARELEICAMSWFLGCTY